MTALRKSARGEACTVMLPGCSYGGDTVVLAHIRRPWNAGTGMKPRDDEAVYACQHCHDEIDRRTRRFPRDAIDSYVLDALMKTHRRMREKGVM